MILRPVSALRDWMGALLEALGMESDAAARSARRLLRADEFGIHTHGLARFPTYVRQLQTGGLKPRPRIVSQAEAGVVTVDADRAFGPLAAELAVEAAVGHLSDERAFVPFIIRNAGHLGALGTHVHPVAAQGLVAFLSQNTQPVMAPAGSRGAAIGNNPIAFAATRSERAPFLLDMSNSVVALSQVLNAGRDGRTIPEGWAIDASGAVTTDPWSALRGAMLPAGGHKGIGLAMLVQVMAGVLSSSVPDETFTSAAPGTGAFGFVVDPFRIAPTYHALMESWTERYLGAAGGIARIPGDRIPERVLKAEQQGIPIDDALVDELSILGRELQLVFPA